MKWQGWARTFACMVCALFCSTTMATISGKYIVAVESDDVITKTLFNEVSKQLEIDIVYLQYPNFDALLKGVASGESDFAANVTYTPERAEMFNFSSPTNIEYTYLFTHFQSNFNWRDASKIAAPKNTIFVDLIEQRYPDIWVAEFDGVEQAELWLSMDLVDGVVDAIHNLKPMLEAGYEADLLNDLLPIKPVSIVAPKGQHQQLLEQIVEVIHQPEVQVILRNSVLNYQRDIRQSSLRSQMALLDRDPEQPITVAIENLYPFAIYADDGTIQGISADTFFQACELLAIACELVSSADDSWDSIYNQFKAGEVDVIAPLTISQSRKDFVHFTLPHYFPVAVLAKRSGYKDLVYTNVSELLIERIGVVKNDFFEELLNDMLPQKKLHQYQNQDQMLQALLSGEVDYIALDRSKLNQWLVDDDKLGITEEQNLAPFHTSEIAVGFQKTEQGQQLAQLFSKAFHLLDTTTINAKYDLTPDWRTTLAREKEYAFKFQAALGIALLLAAVTAWYMFRLALTDNLTALYNRRAMHLFYGHGLNQYQSLCYFDLNDFKLLNDTYGHHFGDKVLQHYAKQIRQQLPGRAFRIGGDEFVVVTRLPNEALLDAIEALRSSSIEIEGAEPIPIEVSIGAFKQEQSPASLSDILRVTDRAMYQAKRDKENRCVVIKGTQDEVA